MDFEELAERARSFQESRVLLTSIDLDLFSAVGDGGQAADVAARLGADPRATEMLLNALAAIGALTKEREIFRNTPASRECGRQRPALMHTVGLWDRWSTLTEAVRTGSAVKFEEIGDRGGPWIEAFIAAMHRNASARAPLVAKAIGLDGVKRMLDVGGGSGAYSIAFAQANPQLHAGILDLAQVLPIAQRHIQEAGLAVRISTRQGDLRKDALGQDHDLVFLSAICHMLSPEENQGLFRRSLEALAPGGRIVLQDFILDPDKTAPPAAALFSLNMLVGTAQGASYSEPEYRAWLAGAGFTDIRHVPLPGPTGLMMGRK